ncbi:NAD-dependent epimerase/dehydratase family protein [Streptomyces sp. SP18CS02]|uniref:NAD-dependent epimerase/dehydratase family protein n=1 Tax=Streptomyces sp. SP18CS02 TaxID=3002531 RepID=UPI002E7956CE|nr:NAD(P)-dependent oxidoreductase [Streptomyces sp. SP18CS02]MEE1757509.1 NAD(P)-dependent oxidoreductase [Streptomyces sp. SP18CS02]
MRILVLGHTGYLGGHVAEQLRTRPGVRLLGGGRAPGAELGVDLATADPLRLADDLAVLAPDAVVNCAGAVGGDAVTLAEVNARGPAVLCAALRQAAPGVRLVHLGSAAEYGPGVHGERVTETAPVRPAAPYGATKLAGTVAVTASGLDAVVLRVGNPVGPGAPAAGLPGGLALRLRRAGDDPDAVVPVGDLSAYRDFVDVRDVARAAVLAATAPGPLPAVLNIGGGKAVPVRELVHALARTAGFRGRIEEAGGGSARSADVSWQCSDITAAREAIGWSPRHRLGDSLAALWAAASAVPEKGLVP